MILLAMVLVPLSNLSMQPAGQELQRKGDRFVFAALVCMHPVSSAINQRVQGAEI